MAIRGTYNANCRDCGKHLGYTGEYNKNLLCRRCSHRLPNTNSTDGSVPITHNTYTKVKSDDGLEYVVMVDE